MALATLVSCHHDYRAVERSRTLPVRRAQRKKNHVSMSVRT